MSPRIIRWLALAALLVPALVLLAPVQAQPGRGGGIGGRPGGIGGLPPGGVQGGIGGVQGGMGGQPGGIAGQPGGMAGQPGGIAGGGGFGGMGPGGGVDEWVCSRCNSVIGHGRIKPAFSRCPSCGAKFTDGPGGFDADPPTGPPAAAPNIPPAPATSGSGSDSGSSSSNRTVLMVVTITAGVLVLAAGVGVIIYFSVSRGSKRTTPRRRKRVIHED